LQPPLYGQQPHTRTNDEVIGLFTQLFCPIWHCQGCLAPSQGSALDA